jgi:hypothetical protein
LLAKIGLVIIELVCKSPFSLIKFIDMDGDLKEELEEFKCSFELDEVVDM